MPARREDADLAAHVHGGREKRQQQQKQKQRDQPPTWCKQHAPLVSVEPGLEMWPLRLIRIQHRKQQGPGSNRSCSSNSGFAAVDSVDPTDAQLIQLMLDPHVH
mmetsp:Transcript_130072/g.259457  ORF Transcript_130072/g.259457 Transcript_130072/m.259457 type:complete len:104 (+) Transcript_130072:165-476(+)